MVVLIHNDVSRLALLFDCSFVETHVWSMVIFRSYFCSENGLVLAFSVMEKL